jgi:predicted DNA-binding transcriptional regulator AlpA
VTKKFLLVEGVAAMTGNSVRTVHELTRQRRIPCRRIAGTRRLLFDEEELIAWIDSGGNADLEVTEGHDGSLVVRVKGSA